MLSCLLLMGCLFSFLHSISEVFHGAQKLAIVDAGISNSISELCREQAKLSMTIQSVLDLAADGQQSLSPAWRNAAISFQRVSQSLDASLKDTQERFRIAETYGLDKGHLVSQLYEFEQQRSGLEDEVLTIIRLTDEGRSSDIATMHESIAASSTLVQEQLEALRQYSQIATLSSTKRIQQASYNILFAGLGTIIFSTFIGIKLRPKRPVFVGKQKKKEDAQNDQEGFMEIATEQALNERFLLRGVHVLVAEDDIDSRRLLAKVFENAGAVVTVACDGVQALSRFRKSADSGHPVQLIILDLMMPDCDGLQVASQEREVEHFTGPILALTAVPDAEMRANCLEAGFDDYLAKPIDRKKILKLATDYLGKTTPVTTFSS